MFEDADESKAFGVYDPEDILTSVIDLQGVADLHLDGDNDLQDLLPTDTSDAVGRIERIFITYAKHPIMGQVYTCSGANQDEIIPVQVSFIPGNGHRTIVSTLVDDVGARAIEAAIFQIKYRMIPSMANHAGCRVRLNAQVG